MHGWMDACTDGRIGGRREGGRVGGRDAGRDLRIGSGRWLHPSIHPSILRRRGNRSKTSELPPTIHPKHCTPIHPSSHLPPSIHLLTALESASWPHLYGSISRAHPPLGNRIDHAHRQCHVVVAVDRASVATIKHKRELKSHHARSRLHCSPK